MKNVTYHCEWCGLEMADGEGICLPEDGRADCLIWWCSEDCKRADQKPDHELCHVCGAKMPLMDDCGESRCPQCKANHTMVERRQ